MKVGVLGVSTSPVLTGTLNALYESGVRIECIILDELECSKKDHEIWQERTAGKIPWISLFEFSSYKTPCYFVKSHNSTLTVELIKSLDIDLLINGGTPRILGLDILNSLSVGVLNVHPGILPYYRGCCCVEWAIYNNDKLGNTVHLMNEKIDAGTIVKIETYSFSKSDDYTDIRSNIHQKGFQLIGNVAREIQKGDLSKINFQVQHENEGQYYKVMDLDKLATVKHRADNGLYKYQFE